MYLINNHGQLTRGDPPDCGLGEGPTTPRRKKKTACYEMLHRTSDLCRAGSCEHSNEPSGSIKGGKFLH